MHEVIFFSFIVIGCSSVALSLPLSFISFPWCSCRGEMSTTDCAPPHPNSNKVQANAKKKQSRSRQTNVPSQVEWSDNFTRYSSGADKPSFFGKEENAHQGPVRRGAPQDNRRSLSRQWPPRLDARRRFATWITASTVRVSEVAKRYAGCTAL